MTTEPEPSFETALQELEAIVRKLEDSALHLNEAVALYEKGRDLAEKCQHLLDTAELKIRTLSAPDTQGVP